MGYTDEDRAEAEVIGKLLNTRAGELLRKVMTELAEAEKENKLLRALACPPISDGDTCICPIVELEAEIERLKAEKAELRAELSDWQCGIMTLEEYEADIRPT